MTKNLYVFFLLLLIALLSTSTLNAQNTSTVTAQNDYGIPYEDSDKSYVNVKLNKYNDLELDSDFNVIKKVNIKELGIPSCNDVPLTFAQCLPSICFENAPFGKIYRKIKGENKDGSCEYIERTPGYGGMDCTFAKDEAVVASDILGKYFGKIANPSKEVTQDDINDVRNLISTKCIVVKDSAMTSLISISTPLDKKGLDPELVISDEELAKMQGKPGEPSTSQDIKDKGNAPIVDQQGQKADSQATILRSSMFTKEELDKIDNVLRGFDTAREEALGILATGGIGFYLNSIIYYGDDKWVIWLNGKKFTTKETGTELTIKDVTRHSADFIWEAKNLDKTVPNWKRRLVYIKDNIYASTDNNIQVEVLGDDNSLIKFTLRPNQTMNLTTMAITEGNKS